MNRHDLATVSMHDVGVALSLNVECGASLSDLSLLSELMLESPEGQRLRFVLSDTLMYFIRTNLKTI